MDEGGSRNGGSLCEGAPCGGPLVRVPLLGTLEDVNTLRTGLLNCLNARSRV